jgi:hypothetical protein
MTNDRNLGVSGGLLRPIPLHEFGSLVCKLLDLGCDDPRLVVFGSYLSFDRIGGRRKLKFYQE